MPGADWGKEARLRVVCRQRTCVRSRSSNRKIESVGRAGKRKARMQRLSRQPGWSVDREECGIIGQVPPIARVRRSEAKIGYGPHFVRVALDKQIHGDA